MKADQYSNKNVEFPDPATDYHGHPKYGLVFLALLAFFGISLLLGYLVSPALAVALIFILAVVKTALVMLNFMHLKFEPIFVWMAIGVVVLILFAFYFGVLPDVTTVPLEVVKK